MGGLSRKVESNLRYRMDNIMPIINVFPSPPVTRWDGEKSEVNQKAEWDSQVDTYKTGWYDELEQEIDQGRVCNSSRVFSPI